MDPVNTKRVWMGGLVGAVVWILWGVLVNYVFLMPKYAAAQEAQLLLKEARYPYFMIIWLVQLVAFSLLISSLYAGVRGSWGAGPGTAIKIGLIVGLAAAFPVNFYISAWAPLSRVIPFGWMLELLVGAVLASLVAGWLYRQK